MDFTREPIIETVITPKEGCKLVVRSSKSTAQEEHFVDAVEVVSFGHSFFFRSTERPKTFLVPATDYEILEVRETRMVLKNVGIDRTIKIAGGREAQMRTHRDSHAEKPEHHAEENVHDVSIEAASEVSSSDKASEPRLDKKRDRRRNNRRRRGRDGAPGDESTEGGEASVGKPEAAELSKETEGDKSPLAQQVMTTSILTSLLPPPPRLISETIAHYKDKFKEAFYTKEDVEKDQGAENGSIQGSDEPLSPEHGAFELSEEEEEKIYLQRKRQAHKQENHNEGVSHSLSDDSPLPEHFTDAPLDTPPQP